MRLCSAAACIWLLAVLPATAFDPGNPASAGYTLSLFDDFHTLKPSLWESNWWYATPTACQLAYLPATLHASGARLDLHVQSLERFSACAGGPQIYSAAHLDSYGKFAQALGYFEARLKSSAAGGTLTAFWLLPQSGAWPPELDIEEIRGDVPDTATSPTIPAPSISKRSMYSRPPQASARRSIPMAP